MIPLAPPPPAPAPPRHRARQTALRPLRPGGRRAAGALSAWPSARATAAWLALPLLLAGSARAQEPAALVALAIPVPATRAAESLVLSALWSAAAQSPSPAIDALAALRAAGGSFEAGRSAAGLWALASAPGDAAGFALSAVEAFWQADDEHSADDLRWAKSLALKERAWMAAPGDADGARTLWQAFYGEAPPPETHEIPDHAIARVQVEELRALARSWRTRPGPALFVTGPVASDDLRRLQGRLPGPRPLAPLPLRAGPQQVPGPPNLPEDRVFLAQVLPRDARLAGPLGEALVQAIQHRVDDLGGGVRLDLRPRGSLLVLDLPARGQSAAEVHAQLSARLRELRSHPPATLKGAGSASATRDNEARPVSLGDARSQAIRYLVFGDVAAGEPLPPADALRRWLLPEAMRMTSRASVASAAPEADAPSSRPAAGE